MAFVELGPVTSRLVHAVGETVDRMKSRNPYNISFEVHERFGVPPEFGPFDDSLFAANAPLRPTERADVEDLHRLRGALYAGKD